MKKKNKKVLPNQSNNNVQSSSDAIRTVPFISETALRQLQQLYGKHETINESLGTLPASSMAADANVYIIMQQPAAQTTPPKYNKKITEDLMNVDLD